jgi:hypothetical protein
MEAIRSSETSVQSTTSTRRHTPEDGILHSHRHGNLKSYNKNLVPGHNLFFILSAFYVNSTLSFCTWWNIATLLGTFKTVFNAEIQLELAELCSNLDARSSGPTRESFMQFASDFPKMNDLNNRFSAEEKIGGHRLRCTIPHAAHFRAHLNTSTR